jgi:hypothetical protein
MLQPPVSASRIRPASRSRRRRPSNGGRVPESGCRRRGPGPDLPGRPARPELVPPRDLKARKLTSREGRAAMIHAVAHIEFNAINLAWDAVQRFRAMPPDFYADWIQVAAEEAEHFGLMRDRLADLGYDYGDFPAHDGLWEMARTHRPRPARAHGLVPRVLEARGLDVTPGMIARFEAAGDPETAARLASSCVTRSAMWPSARVGSGGCARSADSTRAALFRSAARVHARRDPLSAQPPGPSRGRLRRGRARSPSGALLARSESIDR